MGTAVFRGTIGSLGGDVILKKGPLGPIIWPKSQLIIITQYREAVCLEFRGIVWREINPEQVSKLFSTRASAHIK